MPTLEENIAQAISDFDDIEAAIEEKGVNVPSGTDTSQYGNLIRSIPQGGGVGTVDQEYNPESKNAQSGVAVAEALNKGVAVKYLESPKDNKIYFRDIESGYYVMSGYFQPYPNSKSTVVMDTMYVSVARLNAGSHLMSISPLNFKITCYEILVDDTAADGFTYTRTTMSLLDLYNQSKAMVTAIDENSDDKHYPTAKATYTLFNDFCGEVNAVLDTIINGEATASE